MADVQPLSPSPVKKSSGLKKFFRWLVFVFVVVFVVWFWWKYYFTYSDGFRSGLLQKVSYKGNIFKTYEGELVQRSVVSTTGVGLASEKFFFSIEEDSVAKKIQQFEGRNVKLHYKQKNGALPWRGESEYIVDGVEGDLP